MLDTLAIVVQKSNPPEKNLGYTSAVYQEQDLAYHSECTGLKKVYTNIYITQGRHRIRYDRLDFY